MGKISIFAFDIKNWKFTYETTMNEDVLKCIKYVEHDFKDEIQDRILNNDQMKIFEILIK